MTPEYLIETADRCIRLAKTGRRVADELDDLASAENIERCSLLADTGREAAEELDAIGHELMARAVEIDTTRQKSISTSQGS